MKTNNFLKDSFFKDINFDFKRCWAPEGICNSKRIKAHSIQNSKVLDLLNSNGFVIISQKKILNKGETFAVIFTVVGRNETSTFIGLCGKHDKQIFAPIDDFDIDLGIKQQLFLIAYRAIFCKFHMMAVETKDSRKCKKIE